MICGIVWGSIVGAIKGDTKQNVSWQVLHLLSNCGSREKPGCMPKASQHPSAAANHSAEDHHMSALNS